MGWASAVRFVFFGFCWRTETAEASQEEDYATLSAAAWRARTKKTEMIYSSALYTNHAPDHSITARSIAHLIRWLQ